MGGRGSEVMLGSGASLGTGHLVVVLLPQDLAGGGHHPDHQQLWDKALGELSLAGGVGVGGVSSS